MSVDVGEKAIDFAFQNPVDDEKLVINFFGGEPLIGFEVIKRIIEYALMKNEDYGRNLEFTITTNGTVMNEEIAEFLIKNKVGFTLSIDGDEKTHNRYRITANGMGSYTLVESKLSYWLKMQKCGIRITIRMTIDTGNIEGLHKSVIYLNQLGFKKIAYAPNIHDAWSEESIWTLKEQYNCVADYYIDKMKEGNPFSCSNIEKYITCSITKAVIECDAAKGKIAVSPAGNIYPCHAFVREDKDKYVIIGNVNSGFNEHREDFLKNYNREQECTSCKLVNRCGSVCPAINYSTSGDISKKHWFSCEHERISINVSDYVSRVLLKYDTEKFLEHIFGSRKRKRGSQLINEMY